jgi:hypothetical protein
MSEPSNEDLKLWAQDFVKSDFGKYILDILEAKVEGYLSDARSFTDTSIRSLDKSTGVKEAIEAIKTHLDD